jgi:hypothetical protein
LPDSYAYIISNNKIDPIFTRIRSAAKPERFNRDTLNTWGFTASNDRAMVSVMKMLGFINDAGAPTEYYATGSATFAAVPFSKTLKSLPQMRT